MNTETTRSGKERVLAFIAQSAALAVELERELTRLPAVSPDSGGEGELDKCLFLEAFLQKEGLSGLERIDIPDPRAKGGVRPNLVAPLPGGGAAADGRLWIISHLDVVPPGDEKRWQSDPWEARLEGGKIYGRGVEDNQQGLVSSLIAALAFVKCAVQPARPVRLLFAADEECGNHFGIDALLERDAAQAARGEEPLFRAGDMALIPDGGDARGETIEIAEKNLLWVKFITRGVQAHGSRPDEGVNAFLAGSALALALRDGLSAAFDGRDALFTPDYSTFEPTKKEANVPNVNTIPGEDIFYMDMRILPRYPAADVLVRAADIIAKIEAEYRVSIRLEVLQRVQSRPTAACAPVVKMLERAIFEALGVRPRPVGIGGGTVGAFLRNNGIDAAVWSKLDDTAHQPNEYALVDNILDGARVMALLALDNAD